MRTPEDRRRTVGTALLLVIFAVVFILVFRWMAAVELIVLPEPITRFFGLDDPEETVDAPWDTGELYSLLREGRRESASGIGYELTYENLRLALLTDEEPDGSYRNARISYYTKGRAVSSRVLLYESGELFRVELYPDEQSNVRSQLIIADFENIHWIDDGSGERRSIARAEGILGEHEAGFPTVGELIAVVEQFPHSADEDIPELSAQTDSSVTVGDASRYSDCSITMLESNGMSYYFVTYTDDSMGLREEYLVSIEHRMIISQHSYHDGELIYSFELIGYDTDPELWDVAELYTT